MAEERRIQLAAEVDTTRTREGFQEIGQQASSMAAAVAAAGERAGRGVAGVGDGADRAARNVESVQRSLIGSIQRTTAAMEAGSRSSSQYFEVLGRQRGVDASVLEPYLAQLRAVEAAQVRTNSALGTAPAALYGVEMSARATAAALRGVPAQLTDIITSLQGGQAPLTVFLQQGGQLRDMFGSAGGAARALGSYVVSLITPLNLAAAAVVALGVAYHQGAQEAVAYNKAIILTGNAAGTTANQLSDMARDISKSIGTQGQAAEALAALVGTGRVSVANLKQFGQTAVSVEKSIGQSAADTAAIFAELGDAPLKASEKLNQQYRYLTAAIYDQISALQDQGRMQEAGEVAQKAYADAMDGRSVKLIANLGLAERAWAGISGAAKGAWDAMLNVGRADTLEQKLAAVQAKIAKAQKPFDASFGGNSEERGALKANLAEETRLKAQIDAEAKLSAIEAGRVAVEQAKITWSKEGEQYLTRELQLKKDIALVQQQGLAAGVSDAEIASRVGEVRKKYADIAFKNINEQIDAIERRGSIEEEVAKRSALAVASARAAGIATSLAAQVSYAQQVEALDQAAFTREVTRLQQRIALQKQLPESPENRKVQADLRAKIDLIEEQALTRKAQLKNEIYELDVKDTRQAAANLAALADKRDADLASLRSQIQAQKDANAQIGLSKKGVSDFSSALLEEAAVRKEVEAAILDTIIGREQEAEKLTKSAAALRELAQAQREGVLKAAVFEEQKQFWTSVERTAHDTFVSIADGSKSAAQRLKDSFKNIFFDWLYSMTLKKWLINVSGSVTGSNVLGASGLPAAASGVGQVGSLLQVGKGVYDAISTGFTGLTASLGAGLANLGTTLGWSSVQGFGMGLQGTAGMSAQGAAYLSENVAGFSSGAAAAPYVTAAAGIAAGVLGGKLISGGYSVLGNSGNASVLVGTAIGTILGGPLGSAVGGAIGGLVNRAFGMKSKEITGTTLQGTIGANGFSGQNVDAWTQKGGWFRSDKSGSTPRPVDEATTKAISDAYAAITDASAAYAQVLGTNADSVKSRTQTLSIALTKDSAANEKAIADFFVGVADTVARELVPGLDKLQAQGESASAALQRLAGDYQAVESVLMTIGRTSQDAFGAVGLASLEARERLIAAAGGIDALASGTAYFAENFLTLDERMAPIVKNVQDQLAGLGLANVKTTEQYKKTVLGIDLSTQAGADLYAKLLQLAPQFKQVADYTESLSGAMAGSAEALNQRAQIQKEIDDAAMSEAERARAAIAASNLALYDQLQGIKAAAADAAKLADVNAAIQADIDALAKAALPLAEQRALEVKGMATSTLALYERREALQAEAKAAADAKAAAEAAAARRASIELSIAQLLGNTSLARERELAALSASNRVLQLRAYALADADQAVTAALSATQRAIDADKAKVQSNAEAKVAAIRGRIDAGQAALAGAQKSVDTLSGIFNDISSAVKTLRGDVSGQASMAQAKSFIDMALELARAGAMPDAEKLRDAISTVTQDRRESYGSAEDFRFSQMVQAGKLEALGALAGAQKSLAEQQFDALTSANKLAEDQIKAIEKAAAEQVKALDAQWKAAQDAVSVMRGVDLSVRSVAESILALNKTLAALGATRATTSATTGIAGSLPTSGAVAPPATPSIPSSIGTQTGTNGSAAGIEQQLSAAQRAYFDFIKSSAGDVSDKLEYVAGLQDVQALASLEALKGVANDPRESSDDFMRRHGYKVDTSTSDPKKRYIPGFASGGDHLGGLRLVGERGMEIEATGPSRIWNFEQTQRMLSGGANPKEMAALVDMLTRQNERLEKQNERLEKRLAAIDDNTRRSHNLLDQVTSGGNAIRSDVVKSVVAA